MSHNHQMLGIITSGLPDVLRALGLPDWHKWNLALGLGLVWLFLVAWVIFLRSHIRYALGRNHLKILLFGIPIRRVHLGNIRHIHGRKAGVAERWSNMVITRLDRVLVIEKHRGLFKRCLITPDKPYVFRAELERAIRTRMVAKQATVSDIPSTTSVVVNLNFDDKPAAAASPAGR
jgi:hypothetical protein